MSKILTFFKPHRPHEFLSNFFEAPQVYKGKTFRTNEHFFHWCKCASKEVDGEIVLAALTPLEALRRGRKVKMRPDWETTKPAFMLLGLQLKFNQHPDLMARLQATAPYELIEANPKDFYWGAGDGSGLNCLGRLLMFVRETGVDGP